MVSHAKLARNFLDDVPALEPCLENTTVMAPKGLWDCYKHLANCMAKNSYQPKYQLWDAESHNRRANITEGYVLQIGSTLKGSSDLPATAFFTVRDTIPVIFQTMCLSGNENAKDSRRRDGTTSEGKWQVSGCKLRNEYDCKLTHLQFSKLETTANRMSHNDLKEPTETYMQAHPPPRNVILM